LKCLLTNERGKLVAVGWIAKQFAQRWDLGPYLAGLWRNNLVAQSMWQPQNASKSSSQVNIGLQLSHGRVLMERYF
jgi:hypothetical protein